VKLPEGAMPERTLFMGRHGRADGCRLWPGAGVRGGGRLVR
jgi:hypothetical protein